MSAAGLSRVLVLAAVLAIMGCGDNGNHAGQRSRSGAPAAPATGTSPKLDAPRDLLSAPDRASFAKLGERLPGEEGIAITTLGSGGPLSSAGSLRGGVAWSTAKVPVAMAAIAAGVGAQADLVAAITASDNAAAERLWSALGTSDAAAAAATEQVRAAGDRRTVIEDQRLRAGFTAFGQTTWSLAGQARFVAGMACTDAGPRVLALMQRVADDQRWGLGRLGADARFKGGWGPGTAAGRGGGWLDRQLGVVTIAGRPVAVSIATTAPDHATGTQNLTAIARWLTSHVDVTRAPRRPAC